MITIIVVHKNYYELMQVIFKIILSYDILFIMYIRIIIIII